MNARTTCKRSRAVTKHKCGFIATRGVAVTLGSGAGCNVRLGDPALLAEHVRFALAEDGSGDVTVTALGRTYLLIGQGSRSGQ